ncbi:CDP-glucose 4,6-dehydratase [Campylobacter coli]|nr:CDP-glucose 4,6-dehydratase [Campylobacter coli]
MLFKNYRNAKVFLTGHTGFKGSWLGLWLNSLDARVDGYSLQPNTKINHFDLLGGEKLYENSYFSDINNIAKLEDALLKSDPEIIFHLAAQPLVRKSYREPYETFQTNTIGTLNILNISRKLKKLKAVILITTDKVYKNKEWFWGYRENDTLGGYDPYSASKACAEIVIDSMRQSFFNINDFGKKHQVLIASARAGNVIGGGDWSEDRLIPDIVRACVDGKTVEIRNPNSTRPWQHVLEPLYGYLLLGEKLLQGDSQFATSFNFGPEISGNLKVEEVLQIAKKFWNRISYEYKIDLNAPHEANLLMLDTSKAKKMLLWNSFLTVEESIGMTMEWYRSFYDENKLICRSQLEYFLKRMQWKNVF